MAKQIRINKNIKKLVLAFGDRVKKQGIPVSKLVVFGSYAKGLARKESDVDVCVVSPKFGKDTIEELQFLSKQSRYIDSRIEPYPVSPKEYRTVPSSLIFEIKKFGQEVK